MKFFSHGKHFMELLSQENISDHFLTPKIFKFMKFVSNCSSVIKLFGSNFASIVSTLDKLNTPETEAFQETILSFDFVLDHLLMSDVMSHLINCSRTVQQSSVLTWI